MTRYYIDDDKSDTETTYNSDSEIDTASDLHNDSEGALGKSDTSDDETESGDCEWENPYAKSETDTTSSDEDSDENLRRMNPIKYIEDYDFGNPKVEELQKKIRAGKKIPFMSTHELRYMMTPIGQASYNHDHEPIKIEKSRQRVKCEWCGKTYTYSNKRGHNQTKWHKLFKNQCIKLRNALLGPNAFGYDDEDDN